LGGIICVICFIILRYFLKKTIKNSKKENVPLRATYYKCLDEHIVKSKGELIIDNYLYHMGIDHEYEKLIQVHGKVIKYDWYLPEYNIYIEYWGYYGKKYMKRKKEKIHLYRKGKLNLISIEDVMFRDIHLNLQKQLAKKNKHFNETKHCPNCGLLLDERFKNRRLKSRV